MVSKLVEQSDEEGDPAALFVTDCLRTLRITSDSDQSNVSMIVHFAPIDDDDDDYDVDKTREKKLWDTYYDPPLYVQLF